MGLPPFSCVHREFLPIGGMRHVELVANELQEYLVPDLEDFIQSESGVEVAPSGVHSVSCESVWERVKSSMVKLHLVQIMLLAL